MRTKDLVVILAALVVISAVTFWTVRPNASGQATMAAAESKDLPVISVSGEASVNVKPDTVVVNIGVHTEAPNAKDSIAQNSARMNALVDALAKAGVKKDDMLTTRYSVQPVYEYKVRGEPRLIGFQTRNTLQITLSASANVGQIIDIAAGAGANIVENISFQVRDLAKHRDEALTQAMTDARRRAEVLAKSAGVTIKGVKSIVESGGEMPVRPVYAMDMKMAAGPETPIMGGDMVIRFTVRVEYTF